MNVFFKLLENFTCSLHDITCMSLSVTVQDVESLVQDVEAKGIPEYLTAFSY